MKVGRQRGGESPWGDNAVLWCVGRGAMAHSVRCSGMARTWGSTCYCLVPRPLIHCCDQRREGLPASAPTPALNRRRLLSAMGATRALVRPAGNRTMLLQRGQSDPGAVLPRWRGATGPHFALRCLLLLLLWLLL